MKLYDFNRLVKFMELATSSNDGEALNALRMANKLLEANKVTWAKVFGRLVTIEVEEGAAVDPPPANRFQGGPVTPSPAQAAAKSQEQRDQDDHVRHVFQTCLDNVTSGDFRKFILDLERQWQQKGRLSPAQHEALRRTYDRIMNGVRR